MSRSLTLHAVSMLHFSNPPVDPTVVRPILQIVKLAPIPQPQEGTGGRSQLHLLLSDGTHCLMAVIDLQPHSNGIVKDSLKLWTLIKLTDFVCGQEKGRVLLRAFEIISVAPCQIGSTVPIHLTQDPKSESYYHHTLLPVPPTPPNFPFMPSSSSSSSKVALCPSSPPRTTPATANSNASSGQNVEQPQADFLPFPPFSPPPPPPPAARRMPHLPLELQMIIIKDCIELYRQDEKINSSSSSSSGSGAGKKKQQASATAAATTRLAQIVGMELEVMEAEEREEIGTKATSWEVKGGGSGSVLATFVEGDRSPDEEVEERSRWGLALVSKTWNEISLPLLYRNIQLSQPSSYTILASLLTSPPSPFVPPVAKWIKRAVLREVPPTAWLDRESDVGKVIGSLQDLEIFKVRYRARVEGEEGVPVRERGQKEMWDVYPGVNPKVYHQHHLHTFTLPSITSAWPRLRQTSSDFMFCLTHPPPMVQKFPSLPLRSHHLTIQLAGDPARLYRLPRLLHRLGSASHVRHFVATIRCGSPTMASVVLSTLQQEDRLRGKAIIDVSHHTGASGGWVTERVKYASPRANSNNDEAEEETQATQTDASVSTSASTSVGVVLAGGGDGSGSGSGGGNGTGAMEVDAEEEE